MRRCPPLRHHIAAPGLALLIAACGGTSAASIATVWEQTTSLERLGIPHGGNLAAVQSDGRTLELRSLSGGEPIFDPVSGVAAAGRPIALEARIFVPSIDGKLYAYEADGSLAFRSPADAGIGSPTGLAAVDDRHLLLASSSGQLARIEAASGDAEVFNISAPITSAPVAIGSEYAVATDTGEIRRLSADGQLVDTLPGAAPAGGLSVGPDGRWAFGDGSGVRVVDADGHIAWQRDHAAAVTGTRFLDNGDLLAWGDDGRSVRYDADGDEVSVHTASERPIGPPVGPSGGGVAAAEADGLIRWVGPSGEEIASLRLPPLIAVVARGDDVLIVATADQLIALSFIQ